MWMVETIFFWLFGTSVVPGSEHSAPGAELVYDLDVYLP